MVRNELGVLLALNGQLEEAARELAAGNQASPRNATLVNNSANVNLLLGQLPEAIAQYQKAIELDSKLSPGVYLNVGLAYYTFGDTQKATDAFSRSARLSGGEAFADLGVLPPTESTDQKRGDDKGRKKEILERELEKVLLNALAKTQKSDSTSSNREKDSKDLFVNPLPSGGRRGIDPSKKRQLADLLRWILP